MSPLLSRFVARGADVHAAVIDAHGEHAYADVVRRAHAVAAALTGTSREGLAGRRVALLVAPGASFVSAFFGVLLAGGTVVVLSPLHPMPETTYFCEDAGVTTVLTSREHAAHAEPLSSRFPTRAVESLIETPFDHELVTGIAAARDERSPALQLYTSGTTGRPKGAVLTDGNLAVQQQLLGDAWGFSPRDVLLHALPLHHMHGLAIALLTAVGAGATVRMIAFDAARVWDTMTEATVFMGVPSMYHRLFGALDVADAGTRERWTTGARRLRLATSGSAALPVTLAERWRALTGDIPLERFGMTEIGVGLTNPLVGERVAGCVGLPLPTVETRIVGEDGRDAETGELWIRGPSVFAGYHERSEETARAFVAAPGEPGRPWFRTGDTVTRDATRATRPFKILGRTSVDILKSGGYKLSALEIEETLREHPAVAEVAVVGVPDEAWGDRVVACVVTRPAALSVDGAALRAFVRERLAPYKVPKDVVFLGELPKNAVGKVVKPALSAMLVTQARVTDGGSVPPS